MAGRGGGLLPTNTIRGGLKGLGPQLQGRKALCTNECAPGSAPAAGPTPACAQGALEGGGGYGKTGTARRKAAFVLKACKGIARHILRSWSFYLPSSILVVVWRYRMSRIYIYST